MSDQVIVEYCSPTLAGIKTGSLFSYAFADQRKLVETLRRLNGMLVRKGVRVIPVGCCNKRALIYVYRPAFLKRDIRNRKTARILGKLGYQTENPDQCVVCLMEKLKRVSGGKNFPHEIGLFLGYPPEDVEGFIKNKAAGYKSVGYWKVYGDPEAAERTFAKYRNCTRIYGQLVNDGVSLERLAVSCK